jgi:Kef-type K+ transport system membrane component KefB
VGPHGIGWVDIDLPVRILALFGLAFLLFLAGLEIDVERLRGRLLRLASIGFVVTLAVGLAAGLAFDAVGWVSSPLLLAITLSATSLGLVVPVLKDAGQAGSDLGQQTIAASSVADFAAVVLLTLFFSTKATGTGTKLVLFAGFLLLVVAATLAFARVPLFLLALLAARGLPAALYVRTAGRRKAVAAGLLQATSLPFVVTATEIGILLGQIRPVNGAALVGAALLSVVLFPPLALSLLRDDGADAGEPADLRP